MEEKTPVVPKESPTTTFQWKQFIKIESDLIPYKLFFFSFFGAIGAIFPFVSLYFKQLGFSPNEIGIISGVRPLLGFCSGPLWGSLADKWRCRRYLLIISTLGWIAFMMGIGFVPPPRITNQHCPVSLHFTSGNESSSSNTTMPSNWNKLLEDRGWMFDHDDLRRVFNIILVLVIFGELLQSPTSSLADSGCLEHLGTENLHKYGFQRSWGSLGFASLSLSVGAVVAAMRYHELVCGVNLLKSDYRICFYFFAGCMFFTFIAALFYKFSKQEEAKTNGKPLPAIANTFKLFCSIHYGTWLFAAFFMGVCNGVIWSFLYWHLENLGASQLLVGVGSVVNCLSEIVMFSVIFFLFKVISHTKFMVLGLFGYVCRFIVFASVTNPWLVLPVEVLQGCTYAGVWSALTVCMCTAIPSENLATMQGILHGVYWGLGSGSGALIGGILVQRFGAPVTFWVFAVASAVNLLIFIIGQKFGQQPSFDVKYEEMSEYQQKKKEVSEEQS